MTTTLGFAMFSFEGDKTVEAIAKYFRNRRTNGSVTSNEEVITALENLREVDRKNLVRLQIQRCGKRSWIMLMMESGQ